MSKRKNKKKSDSNQNVTVTASNQNVTTPSKNLHSETKKYDIQFLPIVIDPETGYFENIHLFEQLLPILEETSAIFGDDSMPKVENYGEWLQYHLEFVQDAAPWVFAVLMNGKPQGFCWAINWAGNGPGVHSVQVSGISFRKSPIAFTTQGLRQLVDMIFSTTPVYIIRGEYTEDNRAAGLALTRAGFSHPEKQRATMIRNGREVTGIIKSITRPEWQEAKAYGKW